MTTPISAAWAAAIRRPATGRSTVKITAVNTKNPSEKFEYELEGESVDSFKYFDEAEGKFFHPKEVLNNKMREINNNLMLNDSPIFTIKKAGEKANIKAMTFDIEIESI